MQLPLTHDNKPFFEPGQLSFNFCICHSNLKKIMHLGLREISLVRYFISSEIIKFIILAVYSPIIKSREVIVSRVMRLAYVWLIRRNCFVSSFHFVCHQRSCHFLTSQNTRSLPSPIMSLELKISCQMRNFVRLTRAVLTVSIGVWTTKITHICIFFKQRLHHGEKGKNWK